MYIVVIAWLYITVLMAATEKSLVAGLLTLVFYGLAPVALFMWIFGSPARRRAEARKRLPQERPASAGTVVVGDLLGDIDRGDTKPDQ
jgi:membrane protein implicated in regulation of membrane protease activity